MREDAKALHDVAVEGRRAIDLPMEQFGHNYRLYYHRYQESRGGRFVVVEFVSCVCPEQPWEGPSTQVTVLLKGNAYFDGVRHAWVSPEIEEGLDKGYLHYPDLKALAAIFTRLAELFPDES